MKAKIYYQDFMLNHECYDGKGLVVFEDKAVFITEIEFSLEKGGFADGVFRVLNLHPVRTVGFKNEGRFKEAGHTSMSTGDYVKFEDGDIWICAACGWEVRKYENNTHSST